MLTIRPARAVEGGAVRRKRAKALGVVPPAHEAEGAPGIESDAEASLCVGVLEWMTMLC